MIQLPLGVAANASATAPAAAAFPWAAVGMGVMSMVNNAASQEAENQRLRQQAEQYGMTEASIAFSANRKADIMVSEAKDIQTKSIVDKIIVDANQAVTEADLRVSAAAAGVSGGSVDDLLLSTEANAAQQKQQVNTSTNRAKRQLATKFIDTKVSATAQTGRVSLQGTSTGTSRVLAGLSFLSGYQTGLTL